MAFTEKEKALFLPEATITQEELDIFRPTPNAIIPSQTGGIPGDGGNGGSVPGTTGLGLIAPEAALDTPSSQPGVPKLPQGVPDGRFSGEADSLSPIEFGTDAPKPGVLDRFLAGIFSSTAPPGAQFLDDEEKLKQFFQGQQKFLFELLEAMDYLDRPRRVITNTAFFFQDMQRGIRPLSGKAEPLPLGLQGLVTPRRFESVGDAIKKGWSGDDSVSAFKVIESAVVGAEVSNRIEAWQGRHWQTKYPRVATDFVSDMAADAVIDFGISKAIITPVKSVTKAGVLRYGTESMKDAVLKMGKSKLDEGFEAVANAAANDVVDAATTARRSLDDMVQDSMNSLPDELQAGSGDFAPAMIKFQASEAEVFAQQTELLAANARVSTLKAKIDEVGEQIRDFTGVILEDDIAVLLSDKAVVEREIDAALKVGKQFPDVSIDEVVRLKRRRLRSIDRKLNATFNPEPSSASDVLPSQASYDKFKLQTKQGLLGDQLVEATKQADEAHSILSEITLRGHAVDYKATSRDLRRAYVEASINQIDNIKDLDSIEHFIKLASGGTTDDLAELSDEGFDALFAFVDARAKDPKNWAYLSTDAPGPLGAAKRLGRSVFLNQSVSPAWQVFRRLGGERIYQFVDDAFFNRYAHLEKSLAEWDMHLEQLGIKSRVTKRSEKELESLRRVFLAADGRMTNLDEGVATFNVTSGKTAKESWITPITPEEIVAAEFINKEAKGLADMAVAQGRLSHTGKDAPKVIDHYITHLFDRSVAEAGINRQTLQANIAELTASLAGETDPKKISVIEDAIRDLRLAIEGETSINLNEIAELYERVVKTDVDIPEFRRRINAREGLKENADLSFRTMMNHETDALYMQPAYRASNQMAIETGNENLADFTKKWINDLRGVPTRFEAGLEPRAQDINALLESGTAWLPEWTHLQWKAQDRAVRQFSKAFRAKTYFAAMGFNPGPVATNMTQSMLTIGAIGTKSTFKGFESLTTAGGKSMLRHSRMLIGRNPMHTLSLREMSRLSKASGYTFRMVDQWMNVAPAFNGSLHKQIAGSADKLTILRKYGTTEHRGFWESLSKALDAGEFANEVDIANRVAKLTQYSYLRHDAPAFLRTPLGSAFGQFLSWPSNYWQSYIPEMTKWMTTGQSPFGPLSITERATLIRHIVLAETLIAAGDQAGVDLKKHRPLAFGNALPIPLPGGPAPQITPALRVVSGIVNLAISQGNPRKEAAAILELKKGFMIGPAALPIVPFYPAALRRIGRAAEQDDIRPLFFRMSEEDKATKRTGRSGGFGGFRGRGSGGFRGFSR